LWGILGIFIIGIINFSVSFSLSMILAFRSRKIPFEEFTSVIKSVFIYFKENPLLFLFPISVEENETKEV
jgi:site-specific recombinase